jgi:NTE family protein
VLEAQVGLEPNANLDLPTAQTDIATLYGRGDFARIDYELTGPPLQHGVRFTVAEKPWGPDYMVFGMGLSSDTQGENTSACACDTSEPGSTRSAANGPTTS